MANEPRRSADPGDYGVCKPGMLPPDQIAAARGVHEAFLRGLSSALGGYLEIPVTASLKEIREERLAEFLNPAGDHACLITFDLEPACGQAFLSLQAGLAFRALDTLLGTPRDGVTNTRNLMTEIELHIMRDCFGTLAYELQRAWTALNVKFKAASTVSGAPDRAEPAGDTMLVLESTVKLGEAEESLRVAAPSLLLRIAALNAARAAASRLAPSNPDLVHSLGRATCKVEALLEGSTLRMSDLLAMEPGQVLKLAQPAGSSFQCTINGRPKFGGELVHAGERQALQIHSVV